MCTNKPSLLFFSLLLLFSLQAEAALHCDPWIAKLESVQGKVERQARGDVAWESTHTGDLLCPGDKVRTARWARSILQFRNNATVSLDQNSVLILRGPKSNKTGWLLQLLQGAGFFRSRERQELDIETPFVNAVHKGTEFLVNVMADKTEIAVFDGEVIARNTQSQLQINKGFLGIAAKDQTLRVQSLKIAPQDAVQWSVYYPPLIDLGHEPLPVSSGLHAAFAAYQQGDTDGALSRLAAIPLTAQDVPFLRFQAGLLLSVGRVDEAGRSIQNLQQTNADPGSAYALQAIIAVSKNQQQSALELARNAVSLNPKSAEAQIALSYAHQSLFNLEAALQAAQQATQLAPENALAWARLSELQLSTGEHDAALKSAQKALALNPHLAKTHTLSGYAALMQTDTDGAQQAFTQAIRLDSADPLVHLGLGLVKIRTGDVQAGTQELETAVNLDPNNALLRSYLGKGHYELKNTPFAGKEFAIAKEMDSKDPTPWFYDAILKQTTNRPVAALQDMQQALKLNDNRAIYRSRLMLDEDRAVRAASLGRIYKQLGMDDVARQQATASLNTDPGNYSAHRLLADSYLYRPRQELARASEVLQAQLLQPLNYNPVQPQLAYTDLNIPKSVGFADTAFNEYSRFFEGNQQRLTATGLYGSNDTRADEAVISGIHNKFAYSLGQTHYQTDGFRPNADLKHNLYNVFTQYELAPQLSVQAEYRHRETEHGDIQMQGSPGNFDSGYRRHLHQDTYRFGAKLSPAKHSDILFSYIYADRNEALGSTGVSSLGKKQAHQAEAQYLFHHQRFNLTVGGGTYQINNSAAQNFYGFDASSHFNNQQSFAYAYSNIQLLKNLVATVGLAYDNYLDEDEATRSKASQLSPKFGLQWQVNGSLSLRMAGFQSVKAPIIVNQALQPMQVAGFNQFFDDTNGTRATQYGVGLDAKPTEKLYIGAEAYKRELKIPRVAGTDDIHQQVILAGRNEELYRVYAHWLPHTQWQVNSELRLENSFARSPTPYDPDPYKVETAYIPLNLRFFNEAGFFADLGGQFVHQSVLTNPMFQETFTSNFFLLDAAVGYRLPKRYGMISLEAKNLLDKEFKYRDRSFQMNELRASDLIPQRLLFARLTLNF